MTRPHRPHGARAPFALPLSSLLLAFALQWALTAPADAQIRVASLNTLHLGQGRVPYQQNKEPILKALFAGYDVILLQEVMRQANLANVTPGTYYVIATPVQGPTTYKEAYAFLMRPGMVAAANVAYLSTVPGYARPPAGVLLGAQGKWTWFIDYHAVYGRTIGVRRAEVSNTKRVYQAFQATTVNGQKTQRAVMAGDWNLAANDPVFQTLAVGWPIRVLPTMATSLKANGQPSQPYDHFLWDATAVNVTNPALIPVPAPPGSLQGWRKQVSDHLGISALVQ